MSKPDAKDAWYEQATGVAVVTVVLTSIYLPQKKKKSTPCQEDLLRVSDVFHDIKILLFLFHPSLTVLVSPCIGATSNSLNSALFWMKLTSCCREPLDKHLYFVCVCVCDSGITAVVEKPHQTTSTGQLVAHVLSSTVTDPTSVLPSSFMGFF